MPLDINCEQTSAESPSRIAISFGGQAYDYGNDQAAIIAKMGRFHGPMPNEVYAKLQGVVNSRLAASCDQPITGFEDQCSP